MRTYIEHLRTKPEHVRSNIAVMVSGVVTIFIFMFWLSGQNIFLNESETAKRESTPLQSLTSLSANVIDSFRTGFGVREVYVAPDLEVLPGKKK